MSLVFYDTETTGIDTTFDQILQFAAIRTDANLNEMERFEIRCRLLPHIVPAPGAMRVTGVKASQLIDPSLPSHYEMVRAIREKLVSWSPATFIGYNSLDFDENLVRQALYKTLHPPYLTNTSGNSRSDALRMLQATSLFAPNVLAIPMGDSGKPVFKLDRVAPANGFSHERAHDALADVEATIHLCRIVLERAPDIWSSFMRFSQKAAVVDFITTERVFCLSEFHFNQPYSWLVSVIGQHHQNNAEWYAYDLGVQPESLQSLSDEQLSARLKRSPKPIRRLKSNAAPVLFQAQDAPGICRAREYGHHELERRAEILHADEALCARLISAFEALKDDYPPSAHVEKQIYDGFFNIADQKLMDQFHTAPWPERSKIVERFQDARLRTIGWQLIFFERPELLNEDMRREHAGVAARRLLGECDDVFWLTLPNALQELEGLLSDESSPNFEMLCEHRQYLLRRLEQANSDLPR